LDVKNGGSPSSARIASNASEIMFSPDDVSAASEYSPRIHNATRRASAEVTSSKLSMILRMIVGRKLGYCGLDGTGWEAVGGEGESHGENTCVASWGRTHPPAR